MTNDELVKLLTGAGTILAVVLGGGGIAAVLTVFVNRKLGIKTHENEAKRDLNVTWDAIVENLQGQINTQSANFTEQVKLLYAEIQGLKTRQEELQGELGKKERLVLRAISHIGKLESLVPPEKQIPRPEGLE